MIRKLTSLWVLAAFFPLLVNAAGAHKSFQVEDFSKGLDTYHNSSTLPDGYVQSALNGLFDAKAPFSKRQGYTVAWSTKSYSFTGLWTYTDGSNTTWQIARSSDQITANNLAGTIVKISTISANNSVGETNAFGNAYFVDQTQGVYYWNGTSTTYVSGSPHGSIITQFHNRLWVAGAAVPNGNQLYGSKYYDGTTWTTGLNDTDPVQYSIGLQDNFDNITAEYVYLDTLYLFKHYAIFALYGFGQSTFQISQLTQECGCVDGNTIQTYNGGLKFVSVRGVEDFNGYTCKRISDPVKNLVDPAILTGSFSQQSWVQSVQSDWNAGTFSTTTISSIIANPSLVLSTFSITENSSTTWAMGVSNNLVVDPTVFYLNTNNLGNITNPDFESAFSGNWTGSFSQVSSLPLDCGTINPQSGSFYAKATASGTSHSFISLGVEILDVNNNVLNEADFTVYDDCVWRSGSIGTAAIPLGTRVKYRLSATSTAGSSLLTTSDSYILGGGISFYYASGPKSTPILSDTVAFDNVTLGSSTITSGSYTSHVYDTGVTSPTYQMSLAYTVNSTTPTFSILTSTSATGPFSSILTSSGTNAVGNRYSQWTTTITVGNASRTTISNWTEFGTASTGSFKSQIHNVGTLNSWGNFSVQELLNGGAIAFSVCTSTSPTLASQTTCANQTINSQITNSVVTTSSTYVQWFATFTVTAATQAPTLQSATVGWFTGSVQIPMSSTIWDNRYYLSLTTNTADAANDAVLVLSSRGAWSLFDLHVGAFTQYKNSLYHADSSASGNIYLDNQGYADNGNAINAFLQTKELSLGGLAADDYLYTVYPSALNTGTCSMIVRYNVDKSTMTYSLGSPVLNEFGAFSAVRLPFPIDATHQDFGQSVNFTVGTNDSTCDFQFFGLDGLFKSRPVQ